MSDDVFLSARGSERGWSDIKGTMSAAEADWIVKAGRYQIINQRLLRAVAFSDIDRALQRLAKER